MTSWLSKIQTALRALRTRSHRPNADATAKAATAPLTATEVTRLMALTQMVAQTQEGEIDCDQVYALVDKYAELYLRDESAASLLPLVKQHLELCSPCHEEYETLLSILRQEIP